MYCVLVVSTARLDSTRLDSTRLDSTRLESGARRLVFVIELVVRILSLNPEISS
jgi:hypothetical protein